MSTDFTGLIPHGWRGGEAVTKWWRGKHVHLYRLRKDCAQCGAEMTLDVTKAAILGTAKNAGMHLTRCERCRTASKQAAPTSRPFSPSAPTTINEGEEYAQILRERDEAYELQAKLQDTITELRKRLAAYELPEALRQAENKMPWE